MGIYLKFIPFNNLEKIKLPLGQWSQPIHRLKLKVNYNKGQRRWKEFESSALQSSNAPRNLVIHQTVTNFHVNSFKLIQGLLVKSPFISFTKLFSSLTINKRLLCSFLHADLQLNFNYNSQTPLAHHYTFLSTWNNNNTLNQTNVGLVLFLPFSFFSLNSFQNFLLLCLPKFLLPDPNFTANRESDQDPPSKNATWEMGCRPCSHIFTSQSILRNCGRDIILFNTTATASNLFRRRQSFSSQLQSKHFTGHNRDTVHVDWQRLLRWWVGRSWVQSIHRACKRVADSEARERCWCNLHEGYSFSFSGQLTFLGGNGHKWYEAYHGTYS